MRSLSSASPFAMSTDAFAAAIGKGAALQRPDWREALRTGAIFGTIEALTPLVGWLLGSAAVQYVAPGITGSPSRSSPRSARTWCGPG
jgi:putative Mn2+ efflux pump MntP